MIAFSNADFCSFICHFVNVMLAAVVISELVRILKARASGCGHFEVLNIDFAKPLVASGIIFL